MSHGCHDCGSPNSCECDSIAAEDKKNDDAIDVALQSLTSTQRYRLKGRIIKEMMENEIYTAKCKVEREIKERYGIR